MKTKISIKKSYVLANYSAVLTGIIYLINLGSLSVVADIIVVALITILIAYNIYAHSGIALVINEGIIYKKLCFLKRKIKINKNTSLYYRTFMNLQNGKKRLIVRTDEKVIIVWDIYISSIDDIEENIRKHMHS